ncbi:MAG: flagellin [Geminicoccaceae bacterium]
MRVKGPVAEVFGFSASFCEPGLKIRRGSRSKKNGFDSKYQHECQYGTSLSRPQQHGGFEFACETVERFEIVKASDDAASLAVGTKIKADVTALQQAKVNAGQASSMLQVADGGLSQVSDILLRMKALSVQAQSGSISDNERIFPTRNSPPFPRRSTTSPTRPSSTARRC